MQRDLDRFVSALARRPLCFECKQRIAPGRHIDRYGDRFHVACWARALSRITRLIPAYARPRFVSRVEVPLSDELTGRCRIEFTSPTTFDAWFEGPFSSGVLIPTEAFDD